MQSENEKAVEREHSATQGQVGKLPAKRLTVPFGAGIEYVLPAPAPREKLIALFDNRASFAAIQSWRFGHVQPPQWAIDSLLQKIEATRDELLAIIARIPRRDETKRKTTLNAWRAKQARERDAVLNS